MAGRGARHCRRSFARSDRALDPRGLSRTVSPGGPVIAGAARYRLAACRWLNPSLEGNDRRLIRGKGGQMGPGSANELHVSLRQNQCLADILERFDEIALPDAWLVAGCIAQTIWNLA